MARTLDDIQQQMLNSIVNNTELSNLNSTSNTAIYRLMVYIVAMAIWTLEKLFDIHSSEVDKVIYENKPGTARWYRNMSLAFPVFRNGTP